MSQIELHEVTMLRGQRRVLDGVSLRIEHGACVALLGPNGAGKTTLLRAAAGLLKPTQGRVSCDGVDLAVMPLAQRARTIAYLAQAREIGWNLPVRAIVALGALAHADRLSAISEEVIARAMAHCGLVDIADRPVQTLSGGETSRVLLARALAVGAPLLLADEPAAHLDPRYAAETMRLLRAAADGGAGVLVAMHDLALAAQWCTRAIVLHEGRIRADGPPHDVLTPDTLSAVYGVGFVSAEIDGVRIVQARGGP